jgi:UDP-N-acetylmuramoyl-tripeptide--D-alanyl-D-alanine ligase
VLGETARGYHRELGERARELGIEVIGVGDVAWAYEPVAWAATPEGAIAIARERIGPGDAVLVKASRAVGLEGIADEITNFARAWSPS